jgi:hypothetical protein
MTSSHASTRPRRRRRRIAAAGALLACGTGATVVAGPPAAATVPKPSAGLTAGAASYGGGAITPRVDLFYRGGNRTLVVKRAGVNENVGGALTSGVAAAATSNGELVDEVAYGRGDDNAIWFRRFSDATDAWLPWQSLGGSSLGAPALTMVGEPAQPVVYVRGGDNKLWRRTPVGWGGVPAGPTLAADPGGLAATGGAAAFAEEAFVTASDRTIWNWRRADGWHQVGGQSNRAPTATLLPDGSTDLFVVGLDDAVWTSHRPLNGEFGAFTKVGGTLTSAPTAVVDITTRPAARVVLGLGTDGNLWRLADVLDGTATWTVTQVP